MAPRSKGVVVTISGQDRTDAAFAAVEARLKRLEAQSQTFAQRGARVGQALGEGMEHSVPQVAAASAAIRTFEGNLPVRAVERFLTDTLKLGPVLTAAFPLIGAIDFGRLLFDTIEKIHSLIETGKLAPASVARAFAEESARIQQANDELSLKIAKTQQEIDKLEGHHNNGAAVALAEARVESDKLIGSLDGVLKRLTEITREHQIGAVQGFLTNQAPNAGLTKEFQGYASGYQDRAADIEDRYNQELAAAGNNAKKREQVERDHYAAMDKLNQEFVAKFEGRANELRKKQAQAQQAARDQEDAARKALAAGETPSLITTGTQDYSESIRAAEGAARLARGLQSSFRLTQQLQPLESRLESDRGNKADADAGRKAEAERRRVYDAAVKAAEARRDAKNADIRDEAAADKAATDQALDELESRHRALLVSDEEYYAQRQALQKQAIAAQHDANLNQRASLVQEFLAVQTAGAGLTGTDAENNRSRLVELGAKLRDLDREDAALLAQASKATRERTDAETDLARRRVADADALAAGLEARRGGSTAARSQQSRDQYGRRRQELIAEYGSESAPAVQDLDRQQQADQAGIGAQGAQETFERGEFGRRAERTGIDDAQRRGTISTQEAQRERIALDREEADALQPVLEAYQALADAGDLNAAGKVAELQTKIAELKNPVNEVAAEVRDQLGSAFERLFENIGNGKKALQDFGRALQSDVLRDVYKQVVQPGVEAGLGVLIPNQRKQQLPTPQSALGGLVRPTFGGILGSLFDGAGSKGGAGLKVEIVNQTGSPLQVAQATGENLESQLSEKVVHIVLKNASSGGVLSQLFRG